MSKERGNDNEKDALFVPDIVEQRIQQVDIESEMKKSFLDYSMSVIVSRALPDVRDGLKPVHRRILYTLHENGLTPDKAYRKCADTVGSVLGRYHPHGDASVYDAMVRLAQDFSMRYPLVDGHGNFGSVDGDPPAAYRYTESRMSRMSLSMLTDIDKDTVNFTNNYDDRLKEPVVLPSRFPNLLVNGSTGIAVGMATNIPPHNLGEVIDAVNLLIDNPDAGLDELMQHIKGPDFPTGGVIMGRAGIRAAYATGRARLMLRARAEIEEMTRMVGEFFKLDCIYNTRLEPVDLYAGDPIEAYYAGVPAAQRLYRTKRPADKDIVIVNANAKASEANIAISLACMGLSPKGGDIVLVDHTSLGQIPHYVFGYFGKNSGGRMCGRIFRSRPQVRRILCNMPYPDLGSAPLFGDVDKQVYLDSWEETLALLEQDYGPGTRVSVIADGTITYFAREE